MKGRDVLGTSSRLFQCSQRELGAGRLWDPVIPPSHLVHAIPVTPEEIAHTASTRRLMTTMFSTGQSCAQAAARLFFDVSVLPQYSPSPTPVESAAISHIVAQPSSLASTRKLPQKAASVSRCRRPEARTARCAQGRPREYFPYSEQRRTPPPISSPLSSDKICCPTL
jgi:hypothetical protein